MVSAGHVLATLAAVLAFANAELVTVDTTSGKVSGTNDVASVPDNRPYNAFHAIPFGEDMSGANRFKPSMNFAAPWNGVLDVSNPSRVPAHRCVQRETETTFMGQENCLVLSVYTPQLPSTTNPKLPVLVFFYGGAFIIGGADPYDPRRILNEDVIFVVPHYRLGVFGFMTTHTSEAPGNGGLYDQVLALKWIQKNIANFGGDPDKVTISGQSAGAASTGYHLISPLSRGLFRAAILQSGTPLAPWALEERSKVFEYNERIGNAVGCAYDRTAPDDFVDCMRNVDSTDLVKNQTVLEFEDLDSGIRNIGLRGCGPVVQRVGRRRQRVIPASPKRLFAEGRINSVPTMIGTARNDGSAFLASFKQRFLIPNNLTTEDNFDAETIVGLAATNCELTRRGFDEEAAGEFFAEFFLDRTPDDTWEDIIPGMTDMYSTLLFHFDAYQLANMLSRHGVPVYVYSFDYVGERSFYPFLLGFPTDVPGGVSHADDVLLYEVAWPFGLQDERDIAFSREYVRLLTNMATYRDPTPEQRPSDVYPNWPQYKQRRNGARFMSLNDPPEVRRDFSTQFFNSVNDFLGQ